MFTQRCIWSNGEHRLYVSILNLGERFHDDSRFIKNQLLRLDHALAVEIDFHILATLPTTREDRSKLRAIGLKKCRRKQRHQTRDDSLLHIQWKIVRLEGP